MTTRHHPDWEARALAAEAKCRRLDLSLRFAHRQLERVLEKLDGVLGSDALVEDVMTPEGPAGVTVGVEADS